MNFFKTFKDKDVTLNLSITESCAVHCTLTNAQINNNFAYSTLKLVLNGDTIYCLNNNTYKLKPGEYLISSGRQDGLCIIDSKNEVSQFCIHLMPSTIAEAYQTISSADKHDFGKTLPDSDVPNFFENVYNINNSLPISNYLQPVFKKFKCGQKNDMQINEEWIFELAELLVKQEIRNSWAGTGLHAVKKSTRDEILRRLILSKEYIDTYFTTDPSIREISKVASMSECLFYRCFKQAFRTTPYQYVLDKKLEMSKELVLNTKMKLGDVAFSAGFPDIYTFSKAFKKKFQYAPSQIRK